MSARGRAIALASGLVLLAASDLRAAEDEPPPFWLGPDARDAPVVVPQQKKKWKKQPRTEDRADTSGRKPKKERPKPAAARQGRERGRTAEDEAAAILEELDGPRGKASPAGERELPAIVAPPLHPLTQPKVARPPPHQPASPSPEPPLSPPPRPPEPAPLAREPVAPSPIAATGAALPPAPAAEVRPPVVAPGPREEAAAGQGRAIGEIEQPAELLRRSSRPEVTVGAFAGLWTSSAAVSGRQWNLAYGARISAELFGGWSAEIYGARAGNSTGNPYAATVTTRTLLGAHGGYWLYDRGSLAVQAGGGLAASLSSTHYSLRDVGSDPQGADGGAVIKLAPEAGASLRLRPFRLLELRLDATALFRDGRLELFPSLGAGAWVAF